MKIVCAWCKIEIKAGPGNEVSHGICSACEKKFNRQLEETRPKKASKKQIRGFKLFWQFMKREVLI